MTKHVLINGNEMPVKFGFAALMEFTESMKMNMQDLESLGDNITLTQAVKLIWCGLKHGHRVEKVPFDLTVDDVADLMDTDMNVMEDVLKVFSESFGEQEKK